MQKPAFSIEVGKWLPNRGANSGAWWTWCATIATSSRPASCTTWRSCRAPSAAASATSARPRRSPPGIDRSVVDLIAEGTLRDVPFVGAVERARRRGTGRRPAPRRRSTRAVAASSKRGEVEKRRKFRRAYLSRHAMRLVLDAPLPASIVSTRSYLGDLQMHSTWSDGAESIADWPRGRWRWDGSGSASPITRTACRSRAG